MSKPIFHAFVDETGDPHFSNGGSDTFLICATIINEKDVPSMVENLTTLLKSFNLPELKSKKIGDLTKRRNILQQISTWNISVITIYVRKEDFDKTGTWFRYHGTFYKYIERLLISEVVRIFGNVNLTFDTFGFPDYRASFVKYMENVTAKKGQMELFSPEITMSSPRQDCLIQLSDVVGGSIRKFYNNEFDDAKEILSPIWKGQLIVGKPDWMNMVESPVPSGNSVVDRDIMQVALDSVEQFLNENKRKENKAAACETLEFLKGTLLYENPTKFCYRNEIKDWLIYRGYSDYNEEKVSRELISLLREQGVMLVSSPDGIKIPSSMKDVKEHYMFILGQTIPSLKRLKKLHQVVSGRIGEDAISFIDGETSKILNDLNDYR